MVITSDKRIRLSACLIVRDSALTLPACLESLSPWVDELVVVDTGSRDNTPEIAERLGARLFHFSWCDSFSAARNESLRHARGEFLVWIDSDDTIDAVNGRKLQELARHDHDPNVLGFVMQVNCPGPSDTNLHDVTVVDHVKVIRNHRNLYFEGRIHEQVLPSIRRAGGSVSWTDIFVVHSGYDHTPEGQARKRERDLRLLHLELDEQPEHPFTLFNLGMTYTNIGEYQTASQYLEQSIQFAEPSESHLRKAYALLVYDHRMMDRRDEALRICERGMELFQDDPELHFRAGVLCEELGRGRDAVRFYKQALYAEVPRNFGSYDLGIRGFKARQNLAITLMHIGDLDAAEVQWRLMVEEKPMYAPGWRGLGEILIKQRRHNTALVLADQLAMEDELRVEAYLLQARVHEANGSFAVAASQLELAIDLSASDVEPRSRLCRFHFEHSAPEVAASAIRRLIAMEPEDASAHHNLGTTYLRLGQAQEAIECYRRSLSLRPESAHTYVYMGYAMQLAGHVDEALTAWEDALRVSPGYPSAIEAIAGTKPDLMCAIEEQHRGASV